jgi:hypothetical protein
MMLPVCYLPGWVSVDVRGKNVVLSNGRLGYNSDACTDTESPVAVPRINSSVVTDGTVQLNGMDSSDDCTIMKYDWYLEHQENPLFHKYASGNSPKVTGLGPGVYDVKLQVEDCEGNTHLDKIYLRSCFLSSLEGVSAKGACGLLIFMLFVCAAHQAAALRKRSTGPGKPQG